MAKTGGKTWQIFVDRGRQVRCAGIAVVGLIISGGLLNVRTRQEANQSSIADAHIRVYGPFRAHGRGSYLPEMPRPNAKLEKIRSLAASIDALTNMKVGYDSRIQTIPI
jgi:hypothetical protein